MYALSSWWVLWQKILEASNPNCLNIGRKRKASAGGEGHALGPVPLFWLGLGLNLTLTQHLRGSWVDQRTIIRHPSVVNDSSLFLSSLRLKL